MVVLAEARFDPKATERALKDDVATPHMATFLKSLRALRPKTVTVKCYELGAEKKMPDAG